MITALSSARNIQSIKFFLYVQKNSCPEIFRKNLGRTGDKDLRANIPISKKNNNEQFLRKMPN